MWRKFVYSGRERVAYIPPTGPAYQVLDAGKPTRGFRAFVPEKMTDVVPADNLFNMIDRDDLADYPELEAAK